MSQYNIVNLDGVGPCSINNPDKCCPQERAYRQAVRCVCYGSNSSRVEYISSVF